MFITSPTKGEPVHGAGVLGGNAVGLSVTVRTIVIRDFTAEAEVNPDNPEQASLKVVIQAASLSVKDDISDKDKREIERMMQQEILETSSYPEIVYECSSCCCHQGR